MDEIIWLKSHLINWNAMCVEDPYRIQSCSRNLRFSCFVEHVTSVGNTPIGTSTLKQKFKKCLLNYFEIMRYFNCFANFFKNFPKLLQIIVWFQKYLGFFSFFIPMYDLDFLNTLCKISLLRRVLVNHYKDYLGSQSCGRGYGCVTYFKVGDIFS